MEPKSIPTDQDAPEQDEELNTFINKLDAGEFDGHLFEEIRKLRAEHLAKVCRLLVKRKFEEQ